MLGHSSPVGAGDGCASSDDLALFLTTYIPPGDKYTRERYDCPAYLIMDWFGVQVGDLLVSGAR